MPPIRILHVIGRMDRGGAEAMIMNLYRVIDRERIQFDFVEHFDKPASYDDEIRALGGQIYQCPRFTGVNVRPYLRWWKRFFKQHNGEYKVIHGHIGSTASIYLQIAKKYGLYTIAHSHSSGTDHSTKSYLYRILAFPTRWIADYYFACSYSAAKDRYGKKVANSSRCVIWNNAIDTSIYQYNETIRTSIRAKLGLKGLFVIGHVGRFDKAKNQAFLIPVLRELLKLHNNATLVLVGDGPERINVEKLVRNTGLADKVLFLGVRNDVSQLLQAMDVFVFPSVYEGLPVTLVEAQCSGLPCLISDSIPKECILTDGLVTQLSLHDAPYYWAKKINALYGKPRWDYSEEIKNKGFDVHENACKLGEFYLEKNNR